MLKAIIQWARFSSHVIDVFWFQLGTMWELSRVVVELLLCIQRHTETLALYLNTFWCTYYHKHNTFIYSSRVELQSAVATRKSRCAVIKIFHRVKTVVSRADGMLQSYSLVQEPAVKRSQFHTQRRRIVHCLASSLYSANFWAWN